MMYPKGKMKKIIIANFKSNKSASAARNWFNKFDDSFDRSILESINLAIAPSFVSVADFSKLIKQTDIDISLTVQDVSKFPAGSYTGAVSFPNLDDLGVEYAILGHSERRKYFNENSKDVATKVEEAISNKVTPVVCVDKPYLKEQLNMISKNDLAKCVVAYEPISSIGSGKNASLDEVKEIQKMVKTYGENISFIYGGSVSDQNINEYLMVTDGVLVGSKSLEVESFIDLLKASKVS